MSNIENYLSACERKLPDFFDSKVAAATAGCKLAGFHALRSHGDGPPACRVGKRNMFEKSSYLEWLKDRIERARSLPDPPLVRKLLDAD